VSAITTPGLALGGAVMRFARIIHLELKTIISDYHSSKVYTFGELSLDFA
jgi:hypothetical protein